MKLLRLKVDSNFRSIEKGFEIEFHNFSGSLLDFDEEISTFHPYCFAGLNGSGKSNILECLAEIFYFLDCSCQSRSRLPENFKSQFDPKFCREDLDSFELEYLIGSREDADYSLKQMNRVRIIKRNSKIPTAEIKEFPFDDTVEWRAISTTAKEKEPADFQLFLPDFIIGYSSGENEILSIPFIKSRLLQYDEYSEAMREKLSYVQPESKLIYIDAGMSQAVLLANLLFQKEEVIKPLKDELGIEGMHSFRMNLNLHTFDFRRKLDPEEPNHILNYLTKQIENLKRCATCYYEYTHIEDGKPFDRLVLDFWMNDYPENTTQTALRTYFNNDIFELFRFFQILYFLNNRTIPENIKEEVYLSKGYYTDGKIPIPAPIDHTFFFLDFYILKKDEKSFKPKQLLLRNFSDGEHQFLHTLGICSLLKGKRSLLLLDEPETHFNPSWRGKFISTLKNSINAAEPNNRLKEVILTSHSPFIISDCYPDQVVYFSKGRHPKKAKDMNFKTFGTSVDIILERLFGKRQTIGDLSKSKLAYDLDKIKTKKQAQQIKDNIINLGLGDSLEKDLLFASLNEIINQNK